MIYLAFISVFLLGFSFGTLLAFSIFNIVVSSKTIHRTATKAMRRNINHNNQKEKGAILEPKKELNELYEQFFSE